MAGEDKYENSLLAQAEIDVESDYIRMLDDNGVSFKNPFGDVAKALIEEYEGSYLAGSLDTVYGAFSKLSTRVTNNTNTISSHTTAIGNLQDAIVSIESRIVTGAEIEALETKLGL